MSNQLCKCATEFEWLPEHYQLEHHPNCQREARRQSGGPIPNGRVWIDPDNGAPEMFRLVQGHSHPNTFARLREPVSADNVISAVIIGGNKTVEDCNQARESCAPEVIKTLRAMRGIDPLIIKPLIPAHTLNIIGRTPQGDHIVILAPYQLAALSDALNAPDSLANRVQKRLDYLEAGRKKAEEHRIRLIGALRNVDNDEYRAACDAESLYEQSIQELRELLEPTDA